MRIYLILLFFSLPILGFCQEKTAPGPLNNAFDVIILRNGEIVYGLVKKVDLSTIAYQRTDIPDGPIYVIPKDSVYAISYRNQVKDILYPIDSTIFGKKNQTQPIPDTGLKQMDTIPTPEPIVGWWKQGIIHVGVGFLRGYTAVSQVNTYQSSNTFPFILLGYDFQYNNTTRVGIQLGMGSHHFNRSYFDDYDSTTNIISLKENIVSLHLYGKYVFRSSYPDIIYPYALIGIGFENAHIQSSQQLNFYNKPGSQFIVESGSRSLGLGLLARIGISAKLNEQLDSFIDAGWGNSILQLGVSYHL